VGNRLVLVFSLNFGTGWGLELAEGYGKTIMFYVEHRVVDVGSRL
jgi:hypothetical protein